MYETVNKSRRKCQSALKAPKHGLGRASEGLLHQGGQEGLSVEVASELIPEGWEGTSPAEIQSSPGNESAKALRLEL